MENHHHYFSSYPQSNLRFPPEGHAMNGLPWGVPDYNASMLPQYAEVTLPDDNSFYGAGYPAGVAAQFDPETGPASVSSPPATGRTRIKWTREMDAHLLRASNGKKKRSKIADEMSAKFGLSLNTNMVSKRLNTIKYKDTDFKRALHNAMPRILEAINEEARNICGDNAITLEDISKELLPALDRVAGQVWMKMQGHK